MLVGIFEKSRRVRTARNSFWLVESDMSSPVARPRVVGPVAWLEGLPTAPGTGCQADREGEEAAGQANPFCLDFVCARSGVTVLVPATPKARCAAPREALCGVKTWYVASHKRSCTATKGADAGQESNAGARRSGVS